MGEFCLVADPNSEPWEFQAQLLKEGGLGPGCHRSGLGLCPST